MSVERDTGTRDKHNVGHEDNVVTIKKYANRRLYNTATSVYITLEDVTEMVKRGEEFVVIDAKSGEDLTRQILTQIIFERELGDNSILPISFLKNMINMYDDKISELMPAYLEKTMEAFNENQEKFRKYMDRTITEFNPMQHLSDISKQNADMVTKAFSMFNPLDAFFPTTRTTTDNSKKDDKK